MANGKEIKKKPFKSVTLRSKNDQRSFMKEKLGEHLETYKQCSSRTSDRCKKNHGMMHKDDYYHSDHEEHDGKFPICKDCLTELTSNDVGELSRKGLALICPVLNIPFLQDDYESALNGKGKSLGIYIKLILANRNSMRFVDSDSDIVHFQEEVDNGYNTRDIIVDDELFLKWGSYHVKEDIISLEYNYNNIVDTYKVEGVIESEYLIIACHAKLEMDKLRAESKNTDKAFKQYSESLGKLELNPSQQGANSDKLKGIGMIVKQIEETKPVWSDDARLKDVDGMEKYLKKFLLQIMKVFGKYVPESGD